MSRGYGRKPRFYERWLNTILDNKLVLVLVLATLAMLIAGVISFATGAVFYYSWNHGVRPFLATLGAPVGTVTYWTSFFTAWFLVTFVGSLKGVSFNAS